MSSPIPQTRRANPLRRAPLIATLALLAGAGACGASAADPEPGPGSATASTATGGAAAVTRPCAPQARRALVTAAAAVRARRPYEIESDRVRGRWIWEVKVDTGTARPRELDVSAQGTKVLRNRRSARPDRDAVRSRSASISLATAITIAGRRARGCFDEAEIDRTRGRLVWSVSFKQGRTETEVDVDARSGAVVKIERDRND